MKTCNVVLCCLVILVLCSIVSYASESSKSSGNNNRQLYPRNCRENFVDNNARINNRQLYPRNCRENFVDNEKYVQNNSENFDRLNDAIEGNCNSTIQKSGFRSVAYVENWTTLDGHIGNMYDPAYYDSNYITHVHYAFITFDPLPVPEKPNIKIPSFNSLYVNKKPLVTWDSTKGEAVMGELGNSFWYPGMNIASFVNVVQQTSPNTKIHLSIGGWSDVQDTPYLSKHINIL